MQTYKKNLLAGTMVASLMLGGVGTAFAVAAPESNGPTDDSSKGDVQADGKNISTLQEANAAEGTFSYNQTEITPNSVISSIFKQATAGLCNATEDFVVSNPLEWSLTVTGDVDNSFTAKIDELAKESNVQQVMTCSCGGNPADGAAIITADVKGIPIIHLLDRAQARQDVNTITFVASDGSELAMPLSYVVGRHAVLSYEINDEDLSASVGGNNQLWMTRTPANYFVRDITEIHLSTEQTPPANPGQEQVYPNSPNVGIASSATN